MYFTFFQSKYKLNIILVNTWNLFWNLPKYRWHPLNVMVKCLCFLSTLPWTNGTIEDFHGWNPDENPTCFPTTPLPASQPFHQLCTCRSETYRNVKPRKPVCVWTVIFFVCFPDIRIYFVNTVRLYTVYAFNSACISIYVMHIIFQKDVEVFMYVPL